MKAMLDIFRNVVLEKHADVFPQRSPLVEIEGGLKNGTGNRPLGCVTCLCEQVGCLKADIGHTCMVCKNVVDKLL